MGKERHKSAVHALHARIVLRFPFDVIRGAFSVYQALIIESEHAKDHDHYLPSESGYIYIIYTGHHMRVSVLL